MRFLIADDHPVVRRGLRDILADEFPGAEFAEAVSAEDALHFLSNAPVSLLVLDINTPGRTGLDVLRDLQHTYPQLPVIMLSMQPEQDYALRCLRAGASAYISKDCASEELAIAAKRILAGGRYVSPSQAEKLLASLSGPACRAAHELLSDREYEVMRMIAAGRSLTNIAETLHVSVKTVSTYRTRILEKMRFTSNAEITRYALQHRIVE